MKLRRKGTSGSDKVDIQMTPMIDVVFQLLAFFMMSLKINAVEGDFNVKMPLAAPSAGPVDSTLPPILIRLKADSSGKLAGIEVDGNPVRSFQEVHLKVRGLLGDGAVPIEGEGAEVELDCDYNLHYQHVIQAVTAVTGYVKDNKIINLASKIRFTPPKSAPGT